MKISDKNAAMSLFRKYIRSTEKDERIIVNTSMPTKLPIKRFDGSYRTKLISNDVALKIVDAYFSKKEDLIAVFEVVSPPESLSSELQDTQYVEISVKLLSDRLAEGHFARLMSQIGEVTEGEVSKSDAFSMPVKGCDHDVVEDFGSWS